MTNNDVTNHYSNGIVSTNAGTNTEWNMGDFSGQILSDLNLSNYNLSDANLSNANLMGQLLQA